MKYIVLTLCGLAAVTLIIPLAAVAQTDAATSGETFTARVTEVVSDQTTTVDEASIVQQVLRLEAIDGSWAGDEITFDGTQFQVVGQQRYDVGDRVLVAHSIDVDGNDQFFVVDYIRRAPLYWLAALFAVVVVAVGRLKGLRALLVLVLSFMVILWFIVPRIIDGASPLLISIIGAFAILILAVYLTEGFNRQATIAVVSILSALAATGLLAALFTKLAKLTGFASEEATYLLNLGASQLHIQGLLLAGIIIGTMGVLDDIAVSQTSLVRELRQANPRLSSRELYRRSLRVGVAHMSSMVNTLFFAYAGASLPLLILFSSAEVNAPTFSQAINSEMIATEIVRTLVGSIGLVLVVPVSTGLAVWLDRKSPTTGSRVTATSHQIRGHVPGVDETGPDRDNAPAA